LAYGFMFPPIDLAFRAGCALEAAAFIGGLVGLIFSRGRSKRTIGFAFLLVFIFVAVIVGLIIQFLFSLRGKGGLFPFL